MKILLKGIDDVCLFDEQCEKGVFEVCMRVCVCVCGGREGVGG